MPKKPTQKKKSGPLSPLLTKQLEQGLPIIDVVGHKLVGKITGEDAQFIYLDWFGVLSFTPTPVDSGKSFKIVARLTHQTPTQKGYAVSRQGVRGLAFNNDAWLLGLYAAFVKRCENGDYALNPFAGDETVEIQHGAQGDAEAPGMTVASLESTPGPLTEKPAESGNVPN